jgi:hypothetical protein
MDWNKKENKRVMYHLFKKVAEKIRQEEGLAFKVKD